MVPMCSQVICDNVFTCCHSQPGKAISTGRVVRVGSLKRSISQVCNRSLTPMNTKCSHGHDKVCANIIQLETKIKTIDHLFLVWFLILKYIVFIIF